MKHGVGELVWIVSSFSEERIEPPALVIAVYRDIPRVFLNDPEKNAQWMAQEGILDEWVYDILHMGNLEVGVSGEWLRPCTQGEKTKD